MSQATSGKLRGRSRRVWLITGIVLLLVVALGAVAVRLISGKTRFAAGEALRWWDE